MVNTKSLFLSTLIVISIVTSTDVNGHGGQGGSINVHNMANYNVLVNWWGSCYSYGRKQCKKVELRPSWYYQYDFPWTTGDTIITLGYSSLGDEGWKEYDVKTKAHEITECVYWGQKEFGQTLYEGKEGFECFGFRTPEITALIDGFKESFKGRFDRWKDVDLMFREYDRQHYHIEALRVEIDEYKAFFLDTFKLDFCEHPQLADYFQEWVLPFCDLDYKF
ncbi:MAG: hypothetical protein KZQ59_12340 [Candidatus Thiodiazotropha sp. (ex Lucinoma aequizonata)]|nr:hypothetical protein [Candidatus Thiodiazotropha sp. (ex Lucinoma aequizonata)]MCU7895094.1 hypothetical protein [Candidatus Thiodiazotropha sp. (ex Lucinoma aequizonata)]